MHRLALSCRPSQHLEAVITHAKNKGIRAFDTPYVPEVAQTLNKLVKGEKDKPKLFLRTTEDSKEALEYQIRSFRGNAGPNVDLFVLALDPEYQADAYEGEDQSPKIISKLGKTFEVLQEFCSKEPLLAGYGVSSYGFSTGALTSDHIEKANPGSGFSLVQFPANLLERGALNSPLKKWAKGKGYKVLTNRPLTAFDEEGSWRLVEAPFPEEYAEAKDSLLKHLTPPDSASPEEKEACRWMRTLVERIDEQLSQFTSVVHWEAELGQRIIPMIDSEVEELGETTHQLLSRYFRTFGLAVRESGGFRAREHLLTKFPDLRGLQRFQQWPLQKSAFKFVADDPEIDLISIHASIPDQVDEWPSIMK